MTKASFNQLLGLNRQANKSHIYIYLYFHIYKKKLKQFQAIPEHLLLNPSIEYVAMVTGSSEAVSHQSITIQVDGKLSLRFTRKLSVIKNIFYFL